MVSNIYRRLLKILTGEVVDTLAYVAHDVHHAPGIPAHPGMKPVSGLFFIEGPEFGKNNTEQR